jgi:hypothetical protein
MDSGASCIVLCVQIQHHLINSGREKGYSSSNSKENATDLQDFG